MQQNQRDASSLPVHGSVHSAVSSSPLVSIILPTIREEAVQRVLPALQEACRALPSFEIVIVSPFSVSGQGVVHVPETERRGCMAAHKAGYDVSAGNYIITWSDDAAPTPDSFAAIVEFTRRQAAPFLASFQMLDGKVGNRECEDWAIYGMRYARWACFSRETIEIVGSPYYDIAYRNFWSDPDLSLRVYRAGGTVKPCRRATVILNDINDDVQHDNVSNDFDRDYETFCERWDAFYGNGRHRLWSEINRPIPVHSPVFQPRAYFTRYVLPRMPFDAEQRFHIALHHIAVLFSRQAGSAIRKRFAKR